MTAKNPILVRPNSLADPRTIDAMKRHLTDGSPGGSVNGKVLAGSIVRQEE